MTSADYMIDLKVTKSWILSELIQTSLSPIHSYSSHQAGRMVGRTRSSWTESDAKASPTSSGLVFMSNIISRPSIMLAVTGKFAFHPLMAMIRRFYILSLTMFRDAVLQAP